MTAGKQQRTKHDNPPRFEPGKAYKMTDGTRRRVLVLSLETKRAKTDEHEFNQHTYKAVILEGGAKLTIRESALAATASEKPVKITKAELNPYHELSEGVVPAGASDCKQEDVTDCSDETTPVEPTTEAGGTTEPPPTQPASSVVSADDPYTKPESIRWHLQKTVTIADGLSVYQLGKLVAEQLVHNPSVVVDASNVKTVGGRRVEHG